ncbi:MAG: TetR/AcrR family transcriptional regulator [Myxococcales bacterium]|nr:TetR/AcrR family transcriptional regulator [Myxococcales bacterium]
MQEDEPRIERPGAEEGKRARNRRRRLKQLRDAALPLFIDLGIERVTIDDIVQGAGVAKGSFYRYYQDKEDLVAALFDPVSQQVEMALARGEEALARASTWAETMAAFRQVAFELAPLVIQHREVLLLYLQENRAPAVGARRPVRALSDSIARRAIAMTHAARAHGNLRDIEPAVSTLAVIGAVEAIAYDFLSGGGLIGEPAAAASALVMMILDGLQRR